MLAPLLVLFVAAFIAFALSAICGGGAGLLLLPLLGLYLPVTSVPAALSLGTAGSSVSRIVAFKSSIRWSLTRIFVPASLPGVCLGSWLLQYVNPLYLQFIMGAFLLSNLRAFLRPPKIASTSQGKRRDLLLVGFVVGLVSGLTGAVGLLFNAFYLRYGLGKEEIVATRAANEVILHVIKLVLYGLFGLLTPPTLLLGTAVAVAAVASSLAMKWVLLRVSFEFFKRVGYGAMVVAGVGLWSQAGHTLAVQEHGQLTFVPLAGGFESKFHWASSAFSLEFAYDEGIEFEQVIGLGDLPVSKRAFVSERSAGADDVLIEEVFGVDEHSYELYVRRGQRVQKFDF